MVTAPGSQLLGGSVRLSAILTGVVTALALLPSPFVEPTRAQVRGLYSASAEELFARATSGYGRGDLAAARRHLEALGQLPRNQRSSAGQLMLARTLCRMEEFRLGLAESKELISDFTGSRYVADARLVAGDCLYSLRRYYEAATQYGRILAMPAPLPLQARASERLAAIVENRTITSGALDRIRLQVGAGRLRDALAYGRAAWYERLGWEAEGLRALQAYADSVPGGIFQSLAARRLERGGGQGYGVAMPEGSPGPGAPEAGHADAVAAVELPSPVGPVATAGQARYGRVGGPRLGLLLPLSGREAEVHLGQDLLDGVLLANEELGEPFEIVVVDVGSDFGELPISQSSANRLMQVVQGARYLADEAGVMAIVGPVYSDACVSAAAVAEPRGVPLIAPLAQQSGLDSLGYHVFQLNVIPDSQARALAEYATLVLGLETLAILSPLSDYGWAFYRAFSRAVTANGGRVLHREWYFAGETTDFKTQFEAIRRAAFPLMLPAEVDTLAVADSLSLALLDTSMAADVTFLEALGADPLALEEEPDSTGIFVDVIDGLAVVVESFDDARTIAPQVHFHRLRTQLLGNDAWNDPEAIRALSLTERQYLRDCIFVSRRGDASPTARAFTDAFRTRYGRDPGFAAFSYDAAQLVIGGWLAGQQSRSSLRDWLAGRRDHEGASGRISFPVGRRVNDETGLLKIDSRGRIRALTQEDLPQVRGAGDDLPAADLWEGWQIGAEVPLEEPRPEGEIPLPEAETPLDE